MKQLFLILLFSAISGFGQEIQYNLYIKDFCQNKTETSLSYHLEKDGKEYHISDFDAGTVLLHDKGQYVLVATEIGEIHPILIDKMNNSDTLTNPGVNEYVKRTNVSFLNGTSNSQLIKTGVIPNYFFKCCEELCQGIKRAYYSDGTVRLIGKFNKGLPIGELKRFYQTGELKEVLTYDKDGVLIQSTLFDENGHKINKE